MLLIGALPAVAPGDTPPAIISPDAAVPTATMAFAFETLPQSPIERLPNPLAEGGGEPLTLADLEQMALANNPKISVARSKILAARGRQVQVWLYPNPMIGYSGEEIGDGDTAGMQGGFVAQQFITGGKRRLDRAVAGQEIQESQFLLDAQELRVLSDVRLRFYEALVAQRQVELTGELTKISDQSVDLSQRLLEAQQVSRSDLLQAEIEAQEAQVLANNARNQNLEAWRRLTAVVGVATLEPKPLGDDLEANLPDFEWEETYLKVLAENPELSAAQTRIQRARFAITRARREVIPNIGVLASAHHMNTTGDNVAGVEVGLELPIFDRNQGNRMQAEAELIAAQNEVDRIELRLRDQLAGEFRRYANARVQVDRYKNEVLPRAKQSIDLVTQGYGAGQVDFLMLLTSQRTYIRVSLTYLSSLAELRQAATLIEGQLLSDSLQSGGMNVVRSEMAAPAGAMGISSSK